MLEVLVMEDKDLRNGPLGRPIYLPNGGGGWFEHDDAGPVEVKRGLPQSNLSVIAESLMWMEQKDIHG